MTSDIACRTLAWRYTSLHSTPGDYIKNTEMKIRIIEEYICRWHCPKCGHFNNSYYKKIEKIHICIICEKSVTGKRGWGFMNFDYINGLFELIGAFFTWRNAFALYHDKAIKGVYWPTTVYFTAWGLWNLLYYPSLKQWASFAGGVMLVCGNVWWVTLLVKCKRRGCVALDALSRQDHT